MARSPTPLAEDAPLLVDARGHRCPTPTLRLRRALATLDPGGRVVLLADDPLARIDVPHFAAGAGHRLLEQEERDGVWRFTLARGAWRDGEGRG